MRLALLLFSVAHTCWSLNILVFLIGTNQFERNTFEFLAQQLALRHHNVITVKPILIPEEPRLVKPKLHLVKEKTLKNMLPRSMYEKLEKVGDDIPWRTDYDEEEYRRTYWAAHNASCYKMINSNLLDTLKKEALDVAIVYAGNPCQQALSYILAIPTIYFDLEGITDETLVASGSPLSLDIPSSHCNGIQQGSALFRLRNGLCYLREILAQSGVPLLPALISERHRHLDAPITNMFATDYTFKKRFKEFPSSETLKQESSIFFVNSDPLLEYPRALRPNVVMVGGLHLDHPKPLFAPWNNTIEAAEDGMIIVSLGTQANSAAMSKQQARAILGALAKFSSYRIYWRVGPNMELPGIKEEEVPTHINLTTFIPQNDLLAHKRCRLLVTNGGMSSIMEAVAYGIPVVGIPLYGSNRHNLNKVVNKGLGVVVSKKELSEQSLQKAIKNVLDSPKYKTIAKDMSKEFKSRGSSPFEIALHYIEHVGKHHSASFFAAPASNPINLLQLDFCILLLSPLLVFAFLIIVAFSNRKETTPHNSNGVANGTAKKSLNESKKDR